mmetsp:Transcript_8012/g.9655  ORF Transcript_8012/g.9655 Transcript_8012/m.9655 type:complete len:736 (-) Transcript_8012:2332-4539(-)
MQLQSFDNLLPKNRIDTPPESPQDGLSATNGEKEKVGVPTTLIKTAPTVDESLPSLNNETKFPELPPRPKREGIFRPYKSLAEAVSSNRKDWADIALAHGESPNGTLLLDTGANTSVTYLHYASWYGYTDIVKTLLGNKVKANIDARTRACGYTPLHYAAMQGNLEITKILTDFGADVSIGGYKGNDPPLEAALSLHNNVNGKEIVRVLVSKGADLTAFTSRGLPMLHLAYICGGHSLNQESIARFLLKEFPDVVDVNVRTRFGHTLLDHVTRFGDVESMEYLIQNYKAVPGTNRNSPLLFLASQVYSDNLGKDTFATFKAAYEYLDRLDGQRRYFTEPSLKFNTLHCLCDMRLRSDGDVTTQCNYAEILACRKGYLNAVSKNGETPLYLACKAGNLRLVRCLYSMGATLDVFDNNGFNLLHTCSRNGFASLANTLLSEWQLDVEEYDRSQAGATPLIWACGKGHFDTVQNLLDNGAEIFRKTKTSGFSALHAAVRGGYIDIVSLLLNHAQDSCWRNERSKENGRNTQSERNMHLLGDKGEPLSEMKLRQFYSQVCPSKAKSYHILKVLNRARRIGHEKVRDELQSKYGAQVTMDDLKRFYSELCPEKSNNKHLRKVLQQANRRGYSHINDELKLKYGCSPIHSDDDLINFVNAKDIVDGRTALQHAAENGNKNICKLLVKHGADVTLQDNNAFTAIDWANRRGHKSVESFLSKILVKQLNVSRSTIAVHHHLEP